MANRMRPDRPAKPTESEVFSAAPGITTYSLRLYVAGSSLKSAEAVKIVRKLCAAFPRGRCNLEVIDLYQEPELARRDSIIAIPTLVKIDPPPRRAFVGLTQDTDRILQKLGIPMTALGAPRRKARGVSL